VEGGSRRLHNEELHNLYTSSNIIKVVKTRGMRWAGHVACMVGVIYACNFLVRKSEGKRQLGRPGHRD
jgi:hypothetical protein